MVSSTDGWDPRAPAGTDAPGQRPFRCVSCTRRGSWRRCSAIHRGRGRASACWPASMAPSAACPRRPCVCSSSMNRMMLALGILGDLLQHGLQPIFELAAELGARPPWPAMIERQRRACPSGTRAHRSLHDALGNALHDGGLAHTWLTDQHRIVLGTSLQSTCMARRISSSRPMTGSILPFLACSVRSTQNFLRASRWLSASALPTF
jgi:hypothetical protein